MKQSTWMTPQNCRKFVLMALTSVTFLSLTACGPAVQPMTGTGAGSAVNPAKTGQQVPASTWQSIAQAAQAGMQIQYYKEQLTASMSQGSLHSNYSLYGSLNPPDGAYLTLREGNTSLDYYQHGQVAYYLDNGRWSATPDIPNVNVYSSYEQLIGRAGQAGVPLYQQKRAYVFDEYCDVYTSVLPAGMVSALPSMDSVKTDKLGPVAVTWYVGQSDNLLRRVDMQTVGGISDIGEMQLNTSTLIFDINSPVAKVSVPKDLVKQLENVKR